jgi:hypothetical protein
MDVPKALVFGKDAPYPIVSPPKTPFETGRVFEGFLSRKPSKKTALLRHLNSFIFCLSLIGKLGH